jgi:hypothetical protein
MHVADFPKVHFDLTHAIFFTGSYPEPYLLIRTKTEILATDLATLDTTVIMRGLRYNEYESLDTDMQGKKIYFTDVSHIYRANFDGTGKERIVENADPYDITIDWIGHRIFWSDSDETEGKINVASIDGKARRVLVNTYIAKFLKVDPNVG